MKRDRAMLFLLAGGFLMMAIEVRYLHREKLGEEWQAWLPVFFGAIAAVVAGFAATSQSVLRLAPVVFGAGVLIGLYGFFLHTDGKPATIAKMFMSTVVAQAKDDDDREQGEQLGEAGREKKEDEPPAFAPLGIAGLAAIGFVLTSRRFSSATD